MPNQETTASCCDLISPLGMGQHLLGEWHYTTATREALAEEYGAVITYHAGRWGLMTDSDLVEGKDYHLARKEFHPGGLRTRHTITYGIYLTEKVCDVLLSDDFRKLPRGAKILWLNDLLS